MPSLGRSWTSLMAPTTPVEGTVFREGTKESVRDALVTVTSWHDNGNGGHDYSGSAEARTDAEGNFRVIPYHAEFLSIQVTPPRDGTYELLKWEEAKEVLSSKQALLVPRGVVIEGSVVEEGRAAPVAGAHVFYESERD